MGRRANVFCLSIVSLPQQYSKFVGAGGMGAPFQQGSASDRSRKRRSVIHFQAPERLDDFEWMSVGNPDEVAILLGDLRGHITDARHGQQFRR
jgi:hypothetical protein